MSTLAPLLAVLIAGVLISRRVQAPEGSSPPARTAADRRSWDALRLILIGSLLGFGMILALPWIVASAAPTCTILRPGEACVDGDPQSSAPWIFLGVAAIPLMLLVGCDLRRGQLRDPS